MKKILTRIGASVGAFAIVAGLLAGGLSGWSPQARAVPDTAPDFTGIDHWLNSEPLSMEDLRGKVVLVDFWAYSCINCLRTLPWLTHWYDKYKDDGLVIVGVHSPEFDFAKNKANVKGAIDQFGIDYPVAMDSDMDTWDAWDNRFWPAHYLVDKHGNVVKHQYGEGHYRDLENAIRKQLGKAPLPEDADIAPDDASGAKLRAIGSPEMYLGTARVRNMANEDRPSSSPHYYTPPDSLALNEYALAGKWRMTSDYAALVGGGGKIRLHFKSGTVNMVAESDKPVTLDITVDGKKQPSVTVKASKLYTLFDSDDYRDHVITIDMSHSGLHAYTFTFG